MPILVWLGPSRAHHRGVSDAIKQVLWFLQWGAEAGQGSVQAYLGRSWALGGQLKKVEWLAEAIKWLAPWEVFP